MNIKAFSLFLASLMIVVGSNGAVASKDEAGSLSPEEVQASGACEDGNLACLEALMAAADHDSQADDGSSDDQSSPDDDSQSDDHSSTDHDSQSDDGASDDKSSDDDSSSDDDLPLATVSISDGQNNEFNNITRVPVVLAVSLSAPATRPATVSWATADGTAMAGSDYVMASGVLDFATGEQAAELTVFIVGDDIPEPTESFFVRLSMPAGVALLDPEGEVTIFDDDDTDE